MRKFKKIVLAYSGGLDTSVILKWLQEKYECEIVTFTADIGQGEEIEPAKMRARNMGVKDIFIEDLKEDFVRDYVFPMFRANALYEGTYLLGTAIARPLIAKRQIEIANETGGKYFRARDKDMLSEIYKQIDSMERTEIEIKSYTKYKELFGWFLIPALILGISTETLNRYTFNRQT